MSEGVAPAADAMADTEPAALRCYRHPDRETWVRCGGCDQPICSRCTMQGPVGFRCRDCGRPAVDPLTSMRASQLAVGLGLSVLGGLAVGLVTARIGVFGLLLAWFAGGIIADAVIRFVGFKRGPKMIGILFGGILVGAAAAFAGEAITITGSFGPDGGPSAAAYLLDQGLWAALAASIACFGAWSRFRF